MRPGVRGFSQVCWMGFLRPAGDGRVARRPRCLQITLENQPKKIPKLFSLSLLTQLSLSGRIGA